MTGIGISDNLRTASVISRRCSKPVQLQEFLGRIRARERSVRQRYVEERAKRLPAFGHLEHQQPFGWDGRTHLLGTAAVRGQHTLAVGGRAAEGLLDDRYRSEEHTS